MKLVCNQSDKTSINSDSRVDPGVHLGYLNALRSKALDSWVGYQGYLSLTRKCQFTKRD